METFFFFFFFFFANFSLKHKHKKKKKKKIFLKKTSFLLFSRKCTDQLAFDDRLTYLRNKLEYHLRRGRESGKISNQEEAKVLIYYKNHKICIPNSWYFFSNIYFWVWNFFSFLSFGHSRESLKSYFIIFFFFCFSSDEISRYLRNDILWTREDVNRSIGSEVNFCEALRRESYGIYWATETSGWDWNFWKTEEMIEIFLLVTMESFLKFQYKKSSKTCTILKSKKNKKKALDKQNLSFL